MENGGWRIEDEELRMDFLKISPPLGAVRPKHPPYHPTFPPPLPRV